MRHPIVFQAMRKPKNRLVRAAKWSLLVCSVFVALAWISSIRWSFSESFETWRIESFGGLLVIRVWGDGPAYATASFAVDQAMGRPGLEWPAFSTMGYGVAYLSIPYWLILSIVGAPTILMFALTRSRNRPGCCASCGYDLKGNESGTCPECGAKALTSTSGGPKRHHH